MKKQQVREAIEVMLRRWGVPRHLTSLAEKRGCVSVSIMCKDSGEAATVDVATGMSGELAKQHLAELESAIRRWRLGAQTDIEDFTQLEFARAGQ
jgi:hypothetical protein